MCLESISKSYFNHFEWFPDNLVAFDFSGEIGLLVLHECAKLVFSAQFSTFTLLSHEILKIYSNEKSKNVKKFSTRLLRFADHVQSYIITKLTSKKFIETSFVSRGKLC